MTFEHHLCLSAQAKVAAICDNYEETGEVGNLEVKKQILLKQIGAKIAYYRTLRDMSQSELAKRVYLSRSALSRIERGKYHDNVSVITLSDIAEALQIDITLLVTFNEMEKQMWRNPLPSELECVGKLLVDQF